jgi:hypothetical protein
MISKLSAARTCFIGWSQPKGDKSLRTTPTQVSPIANAPVITDTDISVGIPAVLLAHQVLSGVPDTQT